MTRTTNLSDSLADALTALVVWFETHSIAYGVVLPICMLAVLV